MHNRRLPLEGIRVTAVTLVWAGPYACQLLADWGAQVIRVEPISTYQTRTRGPRPRPSKEEVLQNRYWSFGYPDWEPGKRPWNRNPSFNVHGRNQLGMTLDLAKPEGLSIFRRLVAVSDVVIENNVPETGKKLGLEYEALRRVNPSLIMARMPAYGLDGPYRDFRALGSHTDGISGHTWVRGYRDLGPDDREDVYFSDPAAGANGALAILMALRHRDRTGKGQLVELAQVENFTAYLGDVIMDYMMNRRIQTTLGNRHPYMAPHGCYPCRGEDQWLVIAVSTHDEWTRLCRAMGFPPWTRDHRFADELSRLKNQDELDEKIGQWTRLHDKIELMEFLQEGGVPAGAALDQKEVFENPYYLDRGFFEMVDHPEAGRHLYPGMMARFSKTPNCIRKPPVLLGENNEYLYKELLGLTGREYGRLVDEGHIGMDYLPGIR